MTFFFEIAVALALAAFCGMLLHMLRQPAVVGFIFAGIIIGYFGGLKDASHLEFVEALSSIGVALLLFIIGLEMNLRELKDIGLPAAAIGTGQVALSFLGGFWLARFFGMSAIVSAYLAGAFSFSSTAIVVRLLSEKKDLKSLYGRISMGFLLFQDLLAVLISIFLSGYKSGGGVGLSFAIALGKGAILIALAIWLSKVLPKLLDFIGGAPDLLYLFSLAWAVGIGALFASPWIGLSIEPGGFLAGIALANSSEHFQIGAKLKPLRDFFLIILFMGLGAKMIASGTTVNIAETTAFSLFVLIINPALVFVIMVLMRYRARTAFLSSLAASQISEFSFIIMFFGERIGHVGPSELALVAISSIIVITISSYGIVYNGQIYARLRPFLKLFEFKKGLHEEMGEETYLENHIVLAGVHRMGQSILRALSESNEDFVAVDFDPRIVNYLRELNLPALYGDITDSEIQDLVSLDKAKLIISTIPDLKDNIAILEFMRKRNPQAKTILTAESERDAGELYWLGASYVLLPHLVGGLEIADMIIKDKELAGLSRLKRRDAAFIQPEL